MHKTVRRLGLAIALLVLPSALIATAPSAIAAAPSNDDFNNAAVVGGLPFADQVELAEATLQPGETAFCQFMSNTVWYSFTSPTTVPVSATLAGSQVLGGITVNVFRDTGGGLSGLSFVGCNTDRTSLDFTAEAGVKYYITAGGYNPGTLNFSMTAVMPPPNDNFQAATVIEALPFEETFTNRAATLEAGEPSGNCANGIPTNTVWYRYTPPADTSLTVSFQPFSPPLAVAAYTGSNLSNLSQVGGCIVTGNGLLTIHASAGTAYYLQVGSATGDGAQVSFHLAVTPQPIAQFNLTPSPASVFDLVQFFDNSRDPAESGIVTRTWDFGDSTTANGCCPTHRYAKDGDYQITLLVKTLDGRTASATQSLEVRTHDVAIQRLQVQKTVKAGQTRIISVEVSNSRYPETVGVVLNKTFASRLEMVGTVIQDVPVLRTGQTKSFDIPYTFTAEDAAVGKVTFQATAVIQLYNDAAPGDNTATSTPPTKVSP